MKASLSVAGASHDHATTSKQSQKYQNGVMMSTNLKSVIFLLCLFCCVNNYSLAEARQVQPLRLVNQSQDTSSEDTILSSTRDSPSSSILSSYLFFRGNRPAAQSKSRPPSTQVGVGQDVRGVKAKFASKQPLSPVILVPGYGGSRLEAKINKQLVKHYFCEQHTDSWKNIWIDLKLMLPYMIDCLIDDFRLEFESRSNTTHNTEGVEIRVRDPHDLATVEYLTDIHLSSFGYFAAIIRKLTQAFGYERNVNIRGAPYDFRKAPNELAHYFEQLKLTCETMYEQARAQPITFVCHSMGCNNVLFFLQRQPQAWKNKFIRRVISLAAPWGGSMQAVRATAFGDNLGLPYLFDETELKIVQQSVPSTMYLYPSERAFKDEPLVRTHTVTRTPELDDNEIAGGKDDFDLVHPASNIPTPATNRTTRDTRHLGKQNQGETITARDFRRFFEQIKHPNGYSMWLNTKDLLRSLEAPGVEVNCLYGRGHSTLARMEFEGEFPSSKEQDFYTDGDGTVAVQSSATICQDWSREQEQPVTLTAFYANHVEMMKDPDVLSAIEKLMNQGNEL